MSFISSILGGQDKYQAQAATGGAQFQTQNYQPSINAAQSNYADQLAATNNIVGQQGTLAQQLNAQAQGQGPNIAQLQLNQATNQNNQQAASAIASQRGLNPALAARLIAQNQASNNQQAAGQAGVMRAQQQLSAQGQLANVYGQQAGETLQGGSLANQNLGLNQQAFQAQNADIINAQNAAQGINAGVAQANAGAAQQASAGFLGGLSSAFGAMGGGGGAAPAGGGAANIMSSSPVTMVAAEGGEVPDISGTKAPKSFGISLEKSLGTSFTDMANKPITTLQVPGIQSQQIPMFLRGGKVPAMVSPGERYLNPREVKEIHESGENPMEKGREIPGKARVRGDSRKNDIVPDHFEPGGVVLPRSVTKAKDNDSRAKEFMAALKDSKEPGPKGFSKILELKRKMKEMSGHIDEVHEMMKKAHAG